MKRAHAMMLAGSIVVIAAGVWVAGQTYWEEITVPMPMKGEARTNPFYAAQRFAEALGADTAWVRSNLELPGSEGVVLLSGWHWDLSAERRTALKSWVEAGGRLVVDSHLTGSHGDFEDWSGLHQEYPELDPDEDDTAESPAETPAGQCSEVQQRAGPPGAEHYRLCDTVPMTFLEVRGTALPWALGDASGLQVVRVTLGRGSLTAINAAPFRERRLLDGDHARLFVAATQLKKGDVVHFVSEEDHPSLVALIWRNGGAAVSLSLAFVGAALWRGGVRFGPLAAAPENARRSVADQIRGAAQFTLRYDDGDALHRAAVRALHEAAERRIAVYRRLSSAQQVRALAHHTGLDAGELASAIAHASQRSQALRPRIALLEAARRQLLDQTTGLPHVAE